MKDEKDEFADELSSIHTHTHTHIYIYRERERQVHTGTLTFKKTRNTFFMYKIIHDSYTKIHVQKSHMIHDTYLQLKLRKIRPPPVFFR